MVSFIIGLLLSLGLISSEADYYSKSDAQKTELHSRAVDWGDDENGGM